MLLSLFCSGALSGSLFFWLCLSLQTWVEEQIYFLVGPCNACCFIATLCPTLYHPVDCSLPGSSVHGISPGKNTGVGCLFFLQGIFPAQGSHLHLHWHTDSLPLSHLGSPLIFNRKRKEKDTEVDGSGVPRAGSDSVCLSAVGNGVIQWEYLRIILEVVFISLYY